MRRKYDVLLFDADDTLLDFRANEQESLAMVFQELGYGLDEETRALYKTINSDLWRRYEQGDISRQQVLETRFEILFERLGATVDGRNAEKIYRRALGTGSHLIEGAYELCKELAKNHQLYIVTNGVYHTQIQRLKASGLSALMRNVFVSEAIGAPKPSSAFFDYVFANIPSASSKRMLIIGDSLSSDIAGGIGAGIDTCWYNPYDDENNTNFEPTYTIRALSEIFSLLYESPQGSAC